MKEYLSEEIKDALREHSFKMYNIQDVCRFFFFLLKMKFFATGFKKSLA